MGFIRTECSVGDATDPELFISREQEPAADLWSFVPGPPRSHFQGRLPQLRSPSHGAISFAILNDIPRDNSETEELLQTMTPLSTVADKKLQRTCTGVSPASAAAVFRACTKPGVRRLRQKCSLIPRYLSGLELKGLYRVG